MPLVADRDLTGVYIHEALVTHAKPFVAAGDSCLEGRLGETVTEICTVVDDPTMRGYGCYPIDDEGVILSKESDSNVVPLNTLTTVRLHTDMT